MQQQQYEWIHYSHRPIDSFRCVDNCTPDGRVKPRGLYASLGTRWLQVAFDLPDDQVGEEQLKGLHAYTVLPHKQARILDISPTTVARVGKTYKVRGRQSLVPRLNWSLIAEHCDGVFIDVDGLKQMRDETGEKTQWYWLASAFDVPTLCMWRSTKLVQQ